MNKKELLKKEMALNNLFPKVNGDVHSRIYLNFLEKTIQEFTFGILYFEFNVDVILRDVICDKMSEYDFKKTKY